MRRAVVPATLLLSCAVGVAGGAVLHQQWPDPFSHDTASASGAPSGSGRPDPGASPSGSPTATPTATPTASPSATPASSPTASPTGGSSTSSSSGASSGGPAFTRLALVQPPDLVAHGWQVARQVDAYPALPTSPVTPCTSIPTDAEGLVAGSAATYTSNRTTAAEVVARFASTAQAERVYDSLRVAVSRCVDAPAPYDRRRITGFHDGSAPRVSDLRWWTTTRLDGDADRGVVGIVRSEDRVALLSLSSAQRDPAVTTDIPGLLALAGRRLV